MPINTSHSELGQSPDLINQRQNELLEFIQHKLPEVISDSRIDFEKLKELLGQERIAPQEHYELTWAGKAQARREVQKTTSHTLRPSADNPVFLTTSHYTPAAKAAVEGIRSDKKVVLIDGAQLAALMIEHDLGVSVSATYQLKRLDSDFFAED